MEWELGNCTTIRRYFISDHEVRSSTFFDTDHGSGVLLTTEDSSPSAGLVGNLSALGDRAACSLKSIHGEKGASVREGFFAYLADATALYFQLKTAFT